MQIVFSLHKLNNLLLLLFIYIYHKRTILFKRISIQILLLFINGLESDRVLCALISIQLLLLFIVPQATLDNIKMYFNTTLVTVYHVEKQRIH